MQINLAPATLATWDIDFESPFNWGKDGLKDLKFILPSSDISRLSLPCFCAVSVEYLRTSVQDL